MRLSILSIGLLLLAISAIDAKAPADMELQLLPETTSPGGRCMDGSMAGYYIRDGDPDLFVIFLKGGGACSDKEACDKRNKTDLGSSKKWENTTDGGNFQDPNCAKNPVFCNATAVYVPYCTSDTHRGSLDVPSGDSFGYYFDGHLNFKAIIEMLISDKGLANFGNKVLFTGGSAGGIGVIFNIDWLANRLSDVTVKGVPFAGWFFPAALEDDLPEPFIPSDYPNFAQNKSGNVQYDDYINNETFIDRWQIADILNEDCVADFGDLAPLACSSAHYAYPYINSSLFNVHSQYDTNQIYSQSGAPVNPTTLDEAYTVQGFVKMWGKATRISLQKILNNETNIVKPQPDGVFSTSCMSHGTQATTYIDGKNYIEVVNDWFTETGDYEQFYRLIESCPLSSGGLPCNESRPKCKLATIADAYCLIDKDIYNRTFYIPATGSCWRIQVFENGTLEADNSDPSCNSAVFNSVGVFSIFDYSDKHVAHFKVGANGYSGSFAFEQNANIANDLELKIDSWIPNEKKYELTVTLPSCEDPATIAPPSVSPSITPSITPSMSPSATPSMIPSVLSPSPCSIEDIYNKTIYISTVPLLSACWRVQVFDSGTLEADFSDPGCTTTGAFNSARIFSNYDYGSGNSAYFEKGGNNGYFGTFSFEESSSAIEQEFQLKSWNPNTKEYGIIITFPKCTAEV